MKDWFQIAMEKTVIQQALGHAVVFGIVISGIMHSDILLKGEPVEIDLLKIGLSFFIPYLVSASSSAVAIRKGKQALLAKEKNLNKFPEQNPNPVLKVSPGGLLIYANQASNPIINAWNIQLGDQLPKEMHSSLNQAANLFKSDPIEIEIEHKTFLFQFASVPEFEFINIYGTDITASKVIGKFPEQNPNPVLKASPSGSLIYANHASFPIINAWNIQIGDNLPEEIQQAIKQAFEWLKLASLETCIEQKAFSFRIVPVPEFGFVNIYATDITAIKKLKEAYEENERLLLNVLPIEIANRLKQGETIIADKFDNIAILFADVVGFSQMSANISPTSLVNMLDSIFTLFDQLADQFGLEKIKTIGDAYMVVGGLRKDMQNPTQVIAEMALAMKTQVAQLSIENEQTIKLRYGIHSGAGVAGVIGRKKFIYDIWGDAVNTASRMESHSIPEHIQVSQSTYQILKNEYEFTERGIIDIKGKGSMQTYFLQGKKA